VAAACYHCGEPVSPAGRWHAPLLGAEREFCCAGCRAVAQTIAQAGFERYYETRTAPGLKPRLEPAPSARACDDAQAQREFTQSSGPRERSATLVLGGIRCAACLWLNEATLRALPGVTRAHVDYASRRAQVSWDPERTRLSALIEALRDVGYDAWPWDPRRQEQLERGERRAALWRLFVAGFGAMQVMMYAFPAYIDDGAGTLARESETLLRWASLALTLPVLVFSCGPFFAGAWRELRGLRPGMDTPIALGIGAGFAASAWATLTGTGAVYFDSIAMLVFLLLGARYLELVARGRAVRSLDRLARWSPEFALRLAEGAPRRVPAHALAAGDRVLVPAGERVPADGVVLTGRSSVDESLLTGEALPLAKAPGAPLAAGSLNLEQPLEMRVERAGGETRAAAIARLVQRAAASRPALVAAADRIAHALTWVVLAVALLAGLNAADPWVAIAVLMATCPCALALAAPVALTRAAGELLARGVALTRASALETLAAATDVVFDKTGTLTAGHLRLAGTRVVGAIPEAGCLALARALEARSRHPLARAFDAKGPAPEVGEAREFPGEGVEGRVGGRRVRIGAEPFCRALARSPAPASADGAPIAVWLADERGWLAEFRLDDAPRPEAPAAVAALRSAGLRLHLLSGDRPAAVAAVGAQLGIAEARGGALPQDKFDYVARLQREGRVVAMIGDGLNDAPVLARADVSFAMGGGADAAQRQADLVVLGDAIGEVPGAFARARRAMRIVRQNFAWALGYNALALPLAAAGVIGPWEAAVGMAASSFIVVLNALRAGGGAGQESAWKASSSSSPSPSPSYS